MSQSKVNARLLGDYLLFVEDKPLVIKSRKARALFAYLVMHNQGIRREQLAELFWPDGALSNLRQVIYEIRKLPHSEDFLIENNGLLSVNISSDLKLFENALEQNNYQQALELYKGELLAGFNISKMADFGDWLEIERARLEQLYLKALENQAQFFEDNREYEKALELCDKTLSIDILNESCYRNAMKLSAYLDDQQSALKYYRRCVKALKENLGIEALPATRELADKISRGELPRPPKAIESLDDKLFQVLAALAISGDDSLALLEHLLDRNALEITTDLSKLESQSYLENNRLLNHRIENEVLELVDISLEKHFHLRIAEFLLKHKSKDKLKIAKHYLGAHEVNKAGPILLKIAGHSFSNSEDNSRELIFLALWTNSDDLDRYQALTMLESLAERISDNELQVLVLDELKQLVWEMQDDEKIANVLLRKGRSLMRFGKTDEAIEITNEAKKIAKRLDSEALELRSDNNLGAIYFYLGKLEQAEGVLSGVANSKNDAERIKAVNNLAVIAGVQGDFEKSYRLFAEALTLARTRKNLDSISACLNNLANTAEKLADYRAGEKHYREVLSLIDRTKDPRTELITLNNLAVIHRKRGSLGLAWNTASEAFDFAEAQNDLRSMALAKSQQMEVARLVADVDLAGKLSKDFIELSQNLGDERLVLIAKWNKLFLEQLQYSDFDKKLDKLSEQLFEQNIIDVAIWAQLQLALNSRDAKQCLVFAKRVTELPINKHQRFLIKIIKQRSALLVNKDKAFVVPGLEPKHSQDYVENALAYSLLSQVYENIDSYKAINYKNKALELLKTQAEGLPKKLKESHLAQIDNWNI